MGPKGHRFTGSGPNHSFENNICYPPYAVIGNTGSPNLCPPRQMARGAKLHVRTRMGGECLLE